MVWTIYAGLHVLKREGSVRLPTESTNFKLQETSEFIALSTNWISQHIKSTERNAEQPAASAIIPSSVTRLQLNSSIVWREVQWEPGKEREIKKQQKKKKKKKKHIQKNNGG